MATVQSPLHPMAAGVAGRAAAATTAGAVAPAPAGRPLVCSKPVGVVSVAEHTPLAWSADGHKLAAVSGNGAIFVLTLDGALFRMNKVLTGGSHAIRALMFHPKDGNILVSAGADGVFVWDVGAGAVVQVISHRTVKALGLPSSTAQASGAHESEVECMCWAFDGASAVTGSKDTNLKVWDTSKPRSWRLLETITGHKAPVLSVKFSSVTARLASAGRDASIKVWDASTLAVDWHAKRADDSGITCGLLGTCESHGDVIALAWTPDGNYIVSGSRDNKVKVWSVTTFAEVRDVFDRKMGMGGKHRSDVNRIHFLPASSINAAGAQVHHLLTCSLDGTVRLWRVTLDDGVKVRGGGEGASSPLAGVGDGGEGAGVGLAASPGVSADLLATAGESGSSVLTGLDAGGAGWDEGTRALLSEILGESSAATVVRAGSSGQDACLSTMRFFGVDDGVSEMEFNPVLPIVAIGSSDNAFALLAYRADTLPWLQQQYDGVLPPGALPPGTNLDPLYTVQAFHGHTRGVTGVKLLPDDRTAISTSLDYTACVFDLPSVERRSVFTLPSSAQCVDVAAPIPGASPFLFVGAGDYIIRAYSSNASDYDPIRKAYANMPVPTPMPPHEMEAARYVGHSGCVLTLAVDGRGKWMASGGRDWSILLWDLTKAPPVIATTPRDESDIPTCAPVAKVDGHNGHVTALAFSSVDAGSLLASAGNDHAIRVWRITAGITGMSLSEVWSSGSRGAGGHSSCVSALAWGRGPADVQSLLFSGSWDGTVKVWSGTKPNRVSNMARTAPLSGEDTPGANEVAPLATMAGHSARVTGVDVAPAGDVLVSVAADYTAHIWRIKEPWSCVATCQSTFADGIFSSVSAGNHVFVTGSDCGLMTWPLRPTGPLASHFTAPPPALAAASPTAGDGMPLTPTLPVMTSAAAGGVGIALLPPSTTTPAGVDDLDIHGSASSAPLLGGLKA